MTHPDFNLEELLQRAEGRWCQIEANTPELAAAVTLQRSLVRRIAGLTAALEQSDWAPPDIETAAIVTTLSNSRALLHEHRVALPTQILEPALHDLCNILANGGAGDAARHVDHVIQEQRLSTTSLLNASLTRRQNDIRTGAIHLGLAPDLLWLVAELTVGPIAHEFQRAVLTNDGIDLKVRETIDAWDRGTCLICGSWPALGECLGGDITLRCSFCGAGWNLQEPACPYCLSPGAQTDPPTSGQPLLQLLFCEVCRGYLKIVEVNEAIPSILLPIEDLATTAADVQAMARNLIRPPLPESPLGESTDAGCAGGLGGS